MKAKRKIKKSAIIFLAALLVLLAGILFFLFHKQQGLSAGRTYLKWQDEQDLDSVKSQVSANRKAKIVEAYQNGNRSVFSLFSDSVLIGDSRVYGFNVFGFVDPDRVLADAGYTIRNIDDMVDAVRALQPETIYLSFGVNDMGLGIGEGEGESGYGSVYEQQVDKLLAVSPNSKIVINSIIPVTPQTAAETPRWDKAQDYNEQLRELADRRGWVFVDNSEISENGNMPYYADDGIHFSDSFYPIWAANMVEAAL